MTLNRLLILCFFILAGCGKTENTLTLIPEGFTGTVKIKFNQESGTDKKYEGEKRVYEIPKNGILKTKFNPQFGYHFPEYYYISESGKRTEIIPLNKLNDKVLDTLDKNKVYAYHFMFMGETVKIDSMGNESEKIEPEIIFSVGNPTE